MEHLSLSLARSRSLSKREIDSDVRESALNA